MTFFINRFVTTSTIQAQRLVGAIRYGLGRDRLEAAYRDRGYIYQETIAGIDPVVKCRDRGVWIDFGDVRLTIEFKTVETIEIHWQTGEEREFYRAVIRTEWAPVDLEIDTTDDGWKLRTDRVRVQIYRDGRLNVFDRQERLVRQEYPPLRVIVDGEPQLERGWQHRSHLQPTEHIYGLGERAQGLNLRGKTIYRLWNTDPQGKYKPGRDPLYICIPVYIGLHQAGSYLVFYENPCDGTMQFAEEAIVSFAGGSLRYYVSVGELPVLLDAYTQLTGRPALPPRWALGYHHCRWGYERESALRKTFRQMLSHQIPIVAMHLDIDCLADFQPGTIATDRFPTLKEFAEELEAEGVKMILILHPCLTLDVGDRFYQEGVAKKYFCTNQAGEPIVAPLWAGDSVFVDFTSVLVVFGTI
jgi:alpha-glucosidase